MLGFKSVDVLLLWQHCRLIEKNNEKDEKVTQWVVAQFRLLMPSATPDSR